MIDKGGRVIDRSARMKATIIGYGARSEGMPPNVRAVTRLCLLWEQSLTPCSLGTLQTRQVMRVTLQFVPLGS
jgi:hypothetical protein